MSIYESIKNTGIDLFVSYHPKVIQLKREAKILHKELKPKGLSLMQCQELTAKQNGFINWYNFIHMIKRNYQVDLDLRNFIITPKMQKDDVNILMGYDINFGHYKWQDDNSMRTHHAILGHSVYERYDVFLAKQAIKRNKNVVFINNAENTETTKQLVQTAIKADRQGDIKIITLYDKSQYPEYEAKLHNSLKTSSGSLTELLISLMPRDDLGDFHIGYAISLISCVIMALVYERDKNQEALMLEKIKESFSIEQIKILAQKKYPDHIEKAFKEYIKIYEENALTPELSGSQLHELIKSALEKTIDILINSQMFSNSSDSINITEMMDRKSPHIYIINLPGRYYNPEGEVFSKLICSGLKTQLAYELGSSLENSQQEIVSLKKIKKQTLYLFIRECYLPIGFAVFPAQARSLGVSVNFSYSSISSLNKLSSDVEAQSILANTNTKIICPIEGDKDTVEYLEKYKSEIDTNSILNIKNKVLEVKIDSSYKKDNYAWLIKKGYAYQVSFDAPFNIFGRIECRNIGVKMKLEDPKETYDLFEEINKT